MKEEKEKTFNILVTGSQSYNNIDKFNNIMTELVNSIDQKIMIFNFNQKYGAQILGRLFAQALQLKYQGWQVSTYFKGRGFKKVNYYRLYYMMQSHAIKKADLVAIFSNTLNEKLNRILQDCKKNNTQYLLIKE